MCVRPEGPGPTSRSPTVRPRSPAVPLCEALPRTCSLLKSQSLSTPGTTVLLSPPRSSLPGLRVFSFNLRRALGRDSPGEPRLGSAWTGDRDSQQERPPRAQVSGDTVAPRWGPVAVGRNAGPSRAGLPARVPPAACDPVCHQNGVTAIHCSCGSPCPGGAAAPGNQPAQLSALSPAATSTAPAHRLSARRDRLCTVRPYLPEGPGTPQRRSWFVARSHGAPWPAAALP